MVDTIKFRAWHKEEKVYYNNVHLLGNAILYSFENDNNFDHIADLDDVILEQYTDSLGEKEESCLRRNSTIFHKVIPVLNSNMWRK